MPVLRPLRILLQRLEDAVLRLLPEPLVSDPFHIEAQFLLFRPRGVHNGKKKLLFRLRAFTPLLSRRSHGILDFLFDFQERARFTGEFHFLKDLVHDLSQHPRLEAGGELATHVFFAGHRLGGSDVGFGDARPFRGLETEIFPGLLRT